MVRNQRNMVVDLMGLGSLERTIIIGIDPRRYIQDTIDKLERGHALSRMSELAPASWAANQAR